MRLMVIAATNSLIDQSEPMRTSRRCNTDEPRANGNKINKDPAKTKLANHDDLRIKTDFMLSLFIKKKAANHLFTPSGELCCSDFER